MEEAPKIDSLPVKSHPGTSRHLISDVQKTQPLAADAELDTQIKVGGVGSKSTVRESLNSHQLN